MEEATTSKVGGKWMRDLFARVVRLYKARGYVGNIAIRGQFGIYGETISKLVQDHQVSAPTVDDIVEAAQGMAPGGDLESSLLLETEDTRTAKLLRSLLSRMEHRAAQWREEGMLDIGKLSTSCGVYLPYVPLVSLSLSPS
jgi:hypothetical protein